MPIWAAWAPTIVAVLTAIFVSGQIAGRIKHQEEALKEHHARLDEHGETLVVHAVAIAENKAWREGYNAAMAK